MVKEKEEEEVVGGGGGVHVWDVLGVGRGGGPCRTICAEAHLRSDT